VVQIVPMPDGVSIVPERRQRRFVRRGPILTIDTGAGEATLEQFEVDSLRDEQLASKDPRTKTGKRRSHAGVFRLNGAGGQTIRIMKDFSRSRAMTAGV